MRCFLIGSIWKVLGKLVLNGWGDVNVKEEKEFILMLTATSIIKIMIYNIFTK